MVHCCSLRKTVKKDFVSLCSFQSRVLFPAAGSHLDGFVLLVKTLCLPGSREVSKSAVE